MDSEQGAASLLESVKAHVNERLRSPFGGAFVIAWLAINWDKLLILFFSKKEVEDKVAFFSKSMSNNDGLWLPLFYAITGLISYYILSGLVIILFEIYGVLKRYIERKFDDYRWVEPDQYISWKRNSIRTIKDFQEIASDKLDKITNLESTVVALEAEKKSADGKLVELMSSSQLLNSNLLAAQNELSKAHQRIIDVQISTKREIEEENEISVRPIVELSGLLASDIMHLQALTRRADFFGEGSEPVKKTISSAKNLITAIDEKWPYQPF